MGFLSGLLGVGKTIINPLTARDPGIVAGKIKGLYHTPNEASMTVEQRRQSQYDQWLQAAGGLDAQGFARNPRAGAPPAEIADRIQALSEKTVSDTNATRRADALGSLQGGLGLLERSRPGGAAALASPFYSQMSNVQMNSQTEAPDMLANVRAQQQTAARKAARGAKNMQIAGGVLQAVATVAAPFTGGASLAAIPLISGAMNSFGKGQTPSGDHEAQAGAGAAGGGQHEAQTSASLGSGSLPQEGPTQGGGTLGSLGGGLQQGPMQGGGTLQSQVGGGGGGPQPGPPGGQGGPQGGPGAAGGGGPQAAPGGGGGQQIMGGGGAMDPGAGAFGPVTPMGTPYPSREGISAAMMANTGPATYPILSRIYASEFGQDEFWVNQVRVMDQMHEQIQTLIAS